MINIVIPNFNGYEHLVTCYVSLKKQSLQDYTVILCDNGSDDKSIEYTKEQFSNSAIIEIGYNSGFAKAVNEGIKYSLKNTNSEYILLLNNDIELAENFIETAISALEKNKDASMLAAKMLNYYNRNIIDDCGDFIKAHGGSPLARGHGEEDKGQYDKQEYIFGACAGAAVYKRHVFEKIGFFDESFFAYYEDIDLSFRAQLAGLKCLYEPLAVCFHKRGGTSSVATHGFQTEMCERNLLLMRIKNYPLSVYLLYQPLFFIARIKRYYSFMRYHSFKIFLRAVKGYFRGILIMVSKLPERFRIQRNRKVSASYIKSQFK
ncbi:MAG: glycosyltransferase family 2 protein [Ignavibacteria bacterium]|nr:glycosyltransferase family 2 protein [Ignavibacteria bacterium]